MIEQSQEKDDPAPKAFACYGIDLRWQGQEEVWLRFMKGNPKSSLTMRFLEWTLTRASEKGARVPVMIWDHASWHKSKMVRTWIHKYNQKVKRSGAGTRLLSVLLPKKSPWLTPLELRWIHAKRKVTEPAHKLSTQEMAVRVCAIFQQPVLPWLPNEQYLP